MEKLLKIPYAAFNDDWDLLQQFLERRGNPMYEIVGDVKLYSRKDIFDLGNLVRVYGHLYLGGSSIKSLGNLEYVGGDLNLNWSSIQSLGNLKYVGENLSLNSTTIQSLGNLEYVGGSLNLRFTLKPIESLGNLKYVGRIILLLKNHNIPQEQLTKFHIEYL